MNAEIGRLGRRGVLTITVEDGNCDVSFKAPGPYSGGRCTIDKGDLFEHCHFGANNWHGEGPDLAALLTECEEATRPRSLGVDEVRWAVERRRASRVAGPPLPSYMRWHGWRPGQGRWLRASSHAAEYLGGYLRDRKVEREFEAEQAVAEARRRTYAAVSGLLAGEN